MNKTKQVRAKILKRLKQYSEIPSLSFREHKFLDFLEKDFHKVNGYTVQRFSTTPSGGQGSYLVVESEKKAPYHILCHLDRVVPVVKDIEIKSDDEWLQGQLDNLIGIAILRYLADQGLSLSIIFTTCEEVQTSHHQVYDFHKRFPSDTREYIDLDIDPFSDKDDVIFTHITLRLADVNSKFYFPLVRKLRNYSTDLGILWKCPIFKGPNPLITQIGHVIQSYGLKGAYLGIPLLNYHCVTAPEKIRWKSVESVIKLLEFILSHKKNGRRLKMLNNNEKARLVYEMIGKIDNPNYRSALLLQMQGCSLSDIKEILLKDSIETVKTFIYRAKQELREIIRKEKT